MHIKEHANQQAVILSLSVPLPHQLQQRLSAKYLILLLRGKLAGLCDLLLALIPVTAPAPRLACFKAAQGPKHPCVPPPILGSSTYTYQA